MSTPHDHDEAVGAQPYAPPYGSAPAYSSGGHGGSYGSGPDTSYGAPAASYGAPTAEPVPRYDSPAEPAYGEPSDQTREQPAAHPGPPHPLEHPGQPDGSGAAPLPPAAAPRRRSPRGPALLLLACLLSGAVGGGVVHALDNGSSTTGTTSTVAGGLTRGTAAAPQAATSGTTQAAAATISPSVVTIAVTGRQAVTGGFGQSGSQAVSDTGSGIVLRADGYIVTNNHVVAAAANGGSVSVTFSDGTTVPARIVGTDATSDLAVVKVDKTGLTPAAFADSDKLVVGQTVLAIGAPLGLSNTVTEGIVSTLHRPVRTGEAGATQQSVIDAVQTDAAINPGNSGGALVDLAGQVVGVNSAIASTGDSSSGSQSGNIGVGFAIPSNDVSRISQQLIANGKATHSQIGISVADAASSATGTPGQGALVQSASAGGPAAAAGLQQGDIITKVDDRAVTDADSLIVTVRSHQPGSTVTVTYLRGGASQTAKVTLTAAAG